MQQKDSLAKMNVGMTEVEAKQILDFLAKKAGCASFKITHYFNGPYCEKQADVILCNMQPYNYDNNSLRTRSLHIAQSNELSSITANDNLNYNYAYFLERMLKYSKNGFDIIFMGTPLKTHVFLPKNTTLEEIMTQMDLDVE